MIAISDFLPVHRRFSDDIEDELYHAWIRVIPPTWEVDMRRQEFIAESRISDKPVGVSLVNYELWITYGGTNIAITVFKRDDTGKIEWTEDAEGEWHPATEVITFSEDITKDDFMATMLRVPTPIIEQWYNIVLEVVPAWAERFRPTPE